MKPFDLEKAKAGEAVITRDGRPVRLVCFDRKGEHPLVGLVSHEDGNEGVLKFTEEGEPENVYSSLVNLRMAPKKYKKWYVFSKVSGWDTEEQAEAVLEEAIRQESMADGINPRDKWKIVELEWEE